MRRPNHFEAVSNQELSAQAGNCYRLIADVCAETQDVADGAIAFNELEEMKLHEHPFQRWPELGMFCTTPQVVDVFAAVPR